MNKCIKCRSYAFNLYKEGIDQGGLCDVHYWQGRAHRAEALAQPEQEPVAFPRQVGDSTWTVDTAFIWRVKHTIDPDTPNDFTPSEEQIETVLLALEKIPSNLYTTPPQRTWVGLTEQEAAKCWSTSTVRTWQAIEAKLKEKNT